MRMWIYQSFFLSGMIFDLSGHRHLNRIIRRAPS